jgi:hypothetical protein
MNSRPAADWPDWRGETAVIVSTGPSVESAPLDRIKGHARTIAIKGACRLLPWADVLYGSDGAWWEKTGGAPGFEGLKLTASPRAARFPNVRQVRLVRTEEILTGETGVIGCGSRRGGGHSGFHALNLAVQFGAREIVLLGIDLSNGHSDTAIHRSALDRAARKLGSAGVSVTYCW